MHDQVTVITHYCIGVNAAGKDVGELQNPVFDPGFAVLETFSQIVIKAA